MKKTYHVLKNPYLPSKLSVSSESDEPSSSSDTDHYSNVSSGKLRGRKVETTLSKKLYLKKIRFMDIIKSLTDTMKNYLDFVSKTYLPIVFPGNFFSTLDYNLVELDNLLSSDEEGISQEFPLSSWDTLTSVAIINFGDEEIGKQRIRDSIHSFLHSGIMVSLKQNTFFNREGVSYQPSLLRFVEPSIKEILMKKDISIPQLVYFLTKKSLDEYENYLFNEGTEGTESKEEYLFEQEGTEGNLSEKEESTKGKSSKVWSPFDLEILAASLGIRIALMELSYGKKDYVWKLLYLAMPEQLGLFQQNTVPVTTFLGTMTNINKPFPDFQEEGFVESPDEYFYPYDYVFPLYPKNITCDEMRNVVVPDFIKLNKEHLYFIDNFFDITKDIFKDLSKYAYTKKIPFWNDIIRIFEEIEQPISSNLQNTVNIIKNICEEESFEISSFLDKLQIIYMLFDRLKQNYYKNSVQLQNKVSDVMWKLMKL